MVRNFVFLAALFAALAAAQETRREITVTPTEADARPNSAQVPDAFAISTQFERVLIFRLKYDADLLAGIERLVKENKVKNAVILSGAGSVRGYHLHQVSNRTIPSKNMFVKDPTGPADIAAMNGYVLNGKVHAHITLANPDKAFGGHLESGTPVFTFAVVTLGVLPDSLEMGRFDEKNFR